MVFRGDRSLVASGVVVSTEVFLAAVSVFDQAFLEELALGADVLEMDNRACLAAVRAGRPDIAAWLHSQQWPWDRECDEALLEAEQELDVMLETGQFEALWQTEQLCLAGLPEPVQNPFDVPEVKELIDMTGFTGSRKRIRIG